MMMTENITYRPNRSPRLPEIDMFAYLKLGFVKDVRHHIGILGFNVYHTKPFWRVWNAAGSDGRGVIGLLEANFIQPAHTKQGFEGTHVLSKLENRLIQHQKTYWYPKYNEISYAPRRRPKSYENSFTITRLAPIRCRQYVEPSGRNQNSDINTQGSGVDIKPTNGNHGAGISIRETGSITEEAELQNVKQESAKLLSKLQNLVSKLQREKEQLELQVRLFSNQLREPTVKIEMGEKEKKDVIIIFQEEKIHRDVTEDSLREQSKEALNAKDELHNQMNILKGNCML